MIKIIKKKINMSDELKAKINHKVIIEDTLYLFFNEQNYFYIGNLKNKIPISDLSDYIARH